MNQHTVDTQNILGSIGNTPLVRLGRITAPESADIFAKLELLNPSGSVKDRIALAMIEDAEREGLITPGSTIIEPTSGNTGIGLAMVCAVKGYKCIIVMPETMSLERIYTLEAYGAKVILTKGDKGMQGAIESAEDLHKKTRNSFIPHQFNNASNPAVHKRTTGAEILRQIDGPIDAFVAGVGTGGTITGVGAALKERYPSVRIIAVEPEASAVLSGKKPGVHKIQGIGAGFIPQVLDRRIIDEVIPVSDREAFETARRLGAVEGIFCGVSSGAAVAASLRVAGVLGKGKKVVTVLPDSGSRYFSTTQYYAF